MWLDVDLCFLAVVSRETTGHLGKHAANTMQTCGASKRNVWTLQMSTAGHVRVSKTSQVPNLLLHVLVRVAFPVICIVQHFKHTRRFRCCFLNRPHMCINYQIFKQLKHTCSGVTLTSIDPFIVLQSVLSDQLTLDGSLYEVTLIITATVVRCISNHTLRTPWSNCYRTKRQYFCQDHGVRSVKQPMTGATIWVRYVGLSHVHYRLDGT